MEEMQQKDPQAGGRFGNLASRWVGFSIRHAGKLVLAWILLGVVGFAGAIPAFLISPWAGVVIDRTDKRKLLVATQVASMLLAGCTPRIEIAASKEPITINMNVKIEHEIHIKVDKDVENLLKSRSDLF